MLIFLCALGGCGVPDNLIYLFVLKPVENAVGSDQNIVKPLCPVLLEDDLRVTDYNTLGAAKMRQFSLAVSERPTDRQPSWKDAVRTNEWVFLGVAFVDGRDFLLDLLRLRGRHAVLHHCLSLIYIPTGFHDAIELVRIGRFVVIGELLDLRGGFHLKNISSACVRLRSENLRVRRELRD